MKKVLFGDFLDLIDNNRESEEFIRMMGHNGEYECRGMVCWEGWDSFEERTVNSIGIEDGEYQVWLDDKE